jgi:hypothetical protein
MRDWGKIVNPTLYELLRAGGFGPVEAFWNVLRNRLGGKAYFYPYKERRRIRAARKKSHEPAKQVHRTPKR